MALMKIVIFSLQFIMMMVIMIIHLQQLVAATRHNDGGCSVFGEPISQALFRLSRIRGQFGQLSTTVETCDEAAAQRHIGNKVRSEELGIELFKFASISPGHPASADQVSSDGGFNCFSSQRLSLPCCQNWHSFVHLRFHRYRALHQCHGEPYRYCCSLLVTTVDNQASADSETEETDKVRGDEENRGDLIMSKEHFGQGLSE